VPDGRPGRGRATATRAAVGAGGAQAAARLAARAAHERELGPADRQARQAAAVGAGRAGHADVLLGSAHVISLSVQRGMPSASRWQVVELQHVAGAAVGVGVARVGLQPADRSGRLHELPLLQRPIGCRRSSRTSRSTARRRAGRRSRSSRCRRGRSRRSGGSAGRLADQHAGGAERQAGAAAALAAADRKLAAGVVGAGAAHLAGGGAPGRARRRHHRAGPERGAGATVHRPLQHSAPVWQVSPRWVQYDGALSQTPSWQ